jgi:hypothetical protein
MDTPLQLVPSHARSSRLVPSNRIAPEFWAPYVEDVPTRTSPAAVRVAAARSPATAPLPEMSNDATWCVAVWFWMTAA